MNTNSSGPGEKGTVGNEKFVPRMTVARGVGSNEGKKGWKAFRVYFFSYLFCPPLSRAFVFNIIPMYRSLRTGVALLGQQLLYGAK